MSDIPNDPTQWNDELDDPTLDDPSEAELDAVEDTAALAEAEAEDAEDDLDSLDEEADPFVEPGAEGPEGTGIEGADDELIEEAGWDDENDAPALDGELDTDPVAAAEQGNRPGDEMVSEDDDDAEVAELSGDDLDVDALADDGIEEVADIDGTPEVIDDNYDED
ncbi:MAG: hypothetical protein ACTH2U_17025 [Brevibacterium sp.]